jgi:NDP-sugar pyrophosphorylase family protein
VKALKLLLQERILFLIILIQNSFFRAFLRIFKGSSITFFQGTNPKMKVGIIAAGEGSRLKQDGVFVPKPLVKVDGIPILERLLLQYHSIGVSEAYCIVNEESDSVRKYIEGKKLPIPVRFHVKTTPSSMHSLFELGQYLRDDHFLLSTVDSIFDGAELVGFMESAFKREVDGLLAVTRPSEDDNPLWVELDDSNRIGAFRRPSSGNLLITGGLYFFSPRIFDLQNEAIGIGMSRLRNFLNLLLHKGYILRAYRFKRIIDLDHAADIDLADEFIQNLGGVKAHT